MKPSRRTRSSLGLHLGAFAWMAVACAATSLLGEPPAAETSRWEKAIAAFEQRDAAEPPPTGAVLFVGSSSIRMWDLPTSFGDLKALNRGFGGSQTADVNQFADRIVLPYRPRVIVFYAGDNDIAAGKSPEQVAADFDRFVVRVRAELPKTRIVYIAIKPSLARWGMYDRMRAANQLIRQATERDDRLAFIDLEAAMLGDDGRPRAELFLDDGLHLNAQGYRAWTELVRPHVE